VWSVRLKVFVGRGAGWSLGEFEEGEGAVAAGWDEEVLAAGGGDESFQAVVAGGDIIGLLQIQGGLVAAHGDKKICGRHKNAKVQLGLRRAIGHIQSVKTRAIGADVDRGAISRARRPLQRRQMPQAMLTVVGVDPGGVSGGVVRALEGVVQNRRAAAVGELVSVTG